MQIWLIVILVLVVLLFGLSPISQSYATAKQAQAAIEASRTAQIATAGHLVSIVVAALVIVAVLTAFVLIFWLTIRVEVRRIRRRAPGPSGSGNWEQVPQPQADGLLPILVTMMLYQMMQSQEQQMHETEQFWMMNEPANDIPSFPDNTWDL